jgi:hypothetical protein
MLPLSSYCVIVFAIVLLLLALSQVIARRRNLVFASNRLFIISIAIETLVY